MNYYNLLYSRFCLVYLFLALRIKLPLSEMRKASTGVSLVHYYNSSRDSSFVHNKPDMNKNKCQ